MIFFQILLITSLVLYVNNAAERTDGSWTAVRLHAVHVAKLLNACWTGYCQPVQPQCNCTRWTEKGCRLISPNLILPNLISLQTTVRVRVRVRVRRNEISQMRLGEMRPNPEKVAHFFL